APVEAGPPRGMAAHNYLRVRPNVSSSPTGLSPATVKSAYGFPTSSTAGAGTTIAIVDAYDHPKIESDLAVFSTQFGLPACTTANGCSFSSETGWSGSGGGCSVYENRNTAQSTGSVTCNGKRATPDVSLVADPASGVSVYDSFRYQGQAGWWTVGGTSASSPMWAA